MSFLRGAKPYEEYSFGLWQLDECLISRKLFTGLTSVARSFQVYVFNTRTIHLEVYYNLSFFVVIYVPWYQYISYITKNSLWEILQTNGLHNSRKSVITKNKTKTNKNSHTLKLIYIWLFIMCYSDSAWKSFRSFQIECLTHLFFF